MTALSDNVRSWGPLAVSALLHAGLALAGVTLLAIMPTSPPAHAQRERGDAWAGDTFQIDGLVTRSGGMPRVPVAPAVMPAPAVKSPRAGAGVSVSASVRRAIRTHRSRSGASVSSAQDLSRAIAAAAQGDKGSRGGRLGAAGVLPGVRDLAKAFTRALPLAVSGDPLWTSLPLGSAGGFRVAIRIDDQGRIASAKPIHQTLTPGLAHLLERTLWMLKAGQFALDRRDVTSGSETLRVELHISMRKPSDRFDVDPSDTVELGFSSPTLDRPGVGYFTLASGRRVEAKVTIERAPSR